MKFKSIALLGILASMAFSSAAFGAGTQKEIAVYMNSMEKEEFTNKPFFSDGEIYLPAREICDSLGRKITYEAPYAVIESDYFTYKISENEYWIGYKESSNQYTLKNYGKNINGTMYIPLEFAKRLSAVSELQKENEYVLLFTWDSAENNNVKSDYTFEANVLKNMPAKENSVISTSGIKSVLALTSNGLGGESQKELLNALNITDIGAFNEIYKNQMAINENSPFLSAKYSEANSIWINNGTEIKEEFSDTAKNYYNATTGAIKNGDLRTINKWIEENYNEGAEIENTNFDVMLLNIAKFNGTWLVPFRESFTKEDVFYSADGDEDKVMFMNFDMPVSDRDKFLYYEEDGLKALSLKYGSSVEPYEKYTPYEMTFVLTEKEITGDTLKNIFNGLKTDSVIVKIPKFNIKNEIDVASMLKNMGVNDMFDPSLADLSNMTEESGYYISDVTQKAYISIDEKGTSAGAISEVDAVRSIEDDKKEFIANKPFYYFIRNKETGDILFEGYVADGASFN